MTMAGFDSASRTPPQPGVTAVYAELIPQLATMARALVRDLDPQARDACFRCLCLP